MIKELGLLALMLIAFLAGVFCGYDSAEKVDLESLAYCESIVRDGEECVTVTFPMEKSK